MPERDVRSPRSVISSDLALNATQGVTNMFTVSAHNRRGSASAHAAQMLHAQQTYGNRVVQRFLQCSSGPQVSLQREVEGEEVAKSVLGDAAVKTGDPTETDTMSDKEYAGKIFTSTVEEPKAPGEGVAAPDKAASTSEDKASADREKQDNKEMYERELRRAQQERIRDTSIPLDNVDEENLRGQVRDGAFTPLGGQRRPNPFGNEVVQRSIAPEVSVQREEDEWNVQSSSGPAESSQEGRSSDGVGEGYQDIGSSSEQRKDDMAQTLEEKVELIANRAADAAQNYQESGSSAPVQAIPSAADASASVGGSYQETGAGVSDSTPTPKLTEEQQVEWINQWASRKQGEASAQGSGEGGSPQGSPAPQSSDDSASAKESEMYMSGARGLYKPPAWEYSAPGWNQEGGGTSNEWAPTNGLDQTREEHSAQIKQITELEKVVEQQRRKETEDALRRWGGPGGLTR